jgi:hypothetical protein
MLETSIASWPKVIDANILFLIETFYISGSQTLTYTTIMKKLKQITGSLSEFNSIDLGHGLKILIWNSSQVILTLLVQRPYIEKHSCTRWSRYPLILQFLLKVIRHL